MGWAFFVSTKPMLNIPPQPPSLEKQQLHGEYGNRHELESASPEQHHEMARKLSGMGDPVGAKVHHTLASLVGDNVKSFVSSLGDRYSFGKSIDDSQSKLEHIHGTLKHDPEVLKFHGGPNIILPGQPFRPNHFEGFSFNPSIEHNDPQFGYYYSPGEGWHSMGDAGIIYHHTIPERYHKAVMAHLEHHHDKALRHATKFE
jgi:hypothetical protein